MKKFLKKIIVIILTLEARLLLQRTKPKIIAVTGNVGKTSTKDTIYTVLKGHIHTRKSDKSYNSEIGVPLSVLGLQNGWNNPIKWLKNIVDGLFIVIYPGRYPKVLVLEMGVDRPGDMDALTKWIKPDIVVLTRLPDVPVHVEFFDSPEDVIAEKQRLVESLKSDGVLVYNQDDSKVVAVAETASQQSIGFSRHTLSPYTASKEVIVYEKGKVVGFEFILTHLNEVASVYMKDTLGAQQTYNYAAATAVGSLFGISLTDACNSLKEHNSPPGRMRLIEAVDGMLILDDTYNSSPIATEYSLQTLAALKGMGRRVVIFGDMLELGQFSVREHERAGEQTAKIADILVTIGVRAHGIATGALEHGFSKKNIFKYDDVTHAMSDIQNVLKTGDVILIKGSQSIRLEKLVETLMAEPNRANELLVRQSSVWKSI